MNRKIIYPIILAVALLLVLLGYVFNIAPIAVTLGLMHGMLDEWPIWMMAVIMAFIFSYQRFYWPIMAICALCASVLYQVYFFTPLIHVSFYVVCVRALLFLSIVFCIDYMRLLFKR